MIQVYDKLLTEDESSDLRREYDGVRFATVAFTGPAALPLVLSGDGARVGELNVEITRDVVGAVE